MSSLKMTGIHFKSVYAIKKGGGRKAETTSPAELSQHKCWRTPWSGRKSLAILPVLGRIQSTGDSLGGCVELPPLSSFSQGDFSCYMKSLFRSSLEFRDIFFKPTREIPKHYRRTGKLSLDPLPPPKKAMHFWFCLKKFFRTICWSKWRRQEGISCLGSKVEEFSVHFAISCVWNSLWTNSKIHSPFFYRN